MTLKEIILAGEGHTSHHEWHVIKNEQTRVCRLYHYDTRMLKWNYDDNTDTTVLDYSIGWGSKSDKDGMNLAFRALGIPLIYRRDKIGGGPRIETVECYA